MGESVTPHRVTGVRRVLRFIVRFVVLPLAVLAALEGLVSIGMLARDIRAARPEENFRQAAYDSLLGWVGIPNLAITDNYGPGLTLHTSADGFRIHRPVTPQLAPGERRIICSGDSFTFGSGVADDQTFCADLEQEFPKVSTLNLAQRGYGIDQAYLSYRRDAARYPHQVNVFAFIWNDFERMALRSFWGYPKPILKLDGGNLAEHNVPVPAWKGWSRWTQASAVLARSRLLQLVQRHVDLSDATKLRRIDDQVWNIAEAVFREMARLNRERGSQLVLVYLPAPPDLVAGAYDHRRERLAKFSQESGIDLLDLTPEIRKLAPDTLDWMFITNNALPVNGSAGHYTAAGHRWVAAQLAAHLRSAPATGGVLMGAQP